MYDSLKQGLSYAKSRLTIRYPLVLLAAVNFTASSALVLAPVFVKTVFQGQGEILGWLMGAAGAGAAFGAMFLVRRRPMRHVAILLWRAPISCLLGLLLLAMAPSAEFALIPMFLIGSGIAITNVAANALLQNEVFEGLRGRVMSLFSAIRFGLEALGGLIAGLVAELAGPAATIVLELIILFVIIVSLRQKFTAVGSELK